ncbi:hypothetical protein HLB23_31815 [Nocardia uniformis]|uniref:Lipoprotein n=1 Tax=Nocardia uniformis TaxID=53432 RepID=A0A849C6Z5_9NOCA|nr:hypothetical protein [Nocardia uniformis]NNH74382.1 hypothetical protein [Nocardia uniformis]
MRISLIAAALVALPLLTACGGGDDTKAPDITQAELAKALQEGLGDEALADCAAKIYMEEGMSQDGLRLMVNKDVTVTPGEADPEGRGLTKEDSDKAMTATNRVISECIK